MVTSDDGEQFTWNKVCWTAELRQQPCAGGWPISAFKVMYSCAGR